METLNNTTYQTSYDNLEVIVGDEKQAAFFPRVKLKRWGNEGNFSIGLIHQGGKHFLKGDKITYDAGDFKAHFHPQNVESEILGEDDKGGFEFSLTLHRKPASNVIPFSIQTKGLTFHYQPPLSKKEAKDSIRPDNVVGSYAVYHESKLHNEYKTGKAFHIYRPWAEDANGQRVWCELNIPTDSEGHATGEPVTITIPQDFLNKATYPVLLDPNLGYTTAGGSSTSLANKMVALAAQTGVGGNTTGTFSQAPTAYISVASTGGTVKVQGAVYRNSDGKLVAGAFAEQTFTSNQAAAFVAVLVAAGLSTESYDLLFWGNTPSAPEFASIFFDTLTNAGKNLTQTYVSLTWPSFSGAAADNNRYSIFDNYSLSTSKIARLNSQDKTASSLTTSVSATYPSTPTQTDLMVAAVYSNTATGTNAISGWTLIQEAAINTNASSISIFAKYAGASESATVTATAAGASAMALGIYEYGGALWQTYPTVAGISETNNHTDNIASGTGAGTSTGVTVAASGDLLFAAAGYAGGNTSAQDWSASGFTNISTGAARFTTAEDLVTNSTSTTYTASLSWTTARTSGVVIAAFRAAPAKPNSALGAG